MMAKKKKKKLLGIPIPLFCTSCNGCILAILAMFIIGGIWNSGVLTPTDDNGDTVVTPGTQDEVQWVLMARLNSWEPSWPNPGYDIDVEVFDTTTVATPPVHSGLMMDSISIAYNNHEWVVGTTHTRFISGFPTTIQVMAFGGTLLLTSNDYVNFPVGSAEAAYNLYDGLDLAGSLSLKWVNV